MVARKWCKRKVAGGRYSDGMTRTIAMVMAALLAACGGEDAGADGSGGSITNGVGGAGGQPAVGGNGGSGASGGTSQAGGQGGGPGGGGSVPVELAWETSWEAATGRSHEALTDGDRLIEAGFPSDRLLEVVQLDDPILQDWPTNALQIEFQGPESSVVAVANAWPAPNVGESIYYRFFLFNALPAGAEVWFEHGMQSNIGDISHAFQLFAPEASTTQFGIGWASRDLPGAYMAQGLPAATPLRVEWAFHREPGEASARVEIRIFDETVSLTSPQWTEADFFSDYGEGNTTIATDAGVLDLAQTSEPNPVTNDPFRQYLFGASGSSPATTCCVLVTGFAVSLDGWIGHSPR